jgi:hypothetical protein
MPRAARCLVEFQTAFPDDAACAALPFRRRWPHGFVCPGRDARKRTVRLRSAAHLMAAHANGISARQLRSPLHVTYKTA